MREINNRQMCKYLIFLQVTQSALLETPESEERPNSLDSSWAWSSSSFSPRSSASMASSSPSISTQNKSLFVVGKKKNEIQSLDPLSSFFNSKNRRIVYINIGQEHNNSWFAIIFPVLCPFTFPQRIWLRTIFLLVICSY